MNIKDNTVLTYNMTMKTTYKLKRQLLNLHSGNEEQNIDNHFICDKILISNLPPLLILDMFLVICENSSSKSENEKKIC